jgi:hypothetical protein
MAYTTINKSSDYFNTKLYTGTGSAQSITGVGFQPDLIWGKNRSATWNHIFTDAVRGANKQISSNLTNAEESNTGEFTAFGSDGFSVGTGSTLNGSGNNICSWNWKANGQGSSNTDGTINSTYTSANTTSGFSIVTYTSGGGSGTVGHGLGSVPKVMFYKPLSTSGGWDVYHHSLGISNRLNLHNNSASSSGYFQTLPTSSVFTEPNLYSGASVIMYCFAEKKGFSKFGSYTGNGSNDGSFIFTGFKPAWLMIKRTTATEDWVMHDNKRDPHNEINSYLLASTNNAETTASVQLDFLSNGFKFRTTSQNTSGENYIYMAFAEAPLVGSNNVPCTAR